MTTTLRLPRMRVWLWGVAIVDVMLIMLLADRPIQATDLAWMLLIAGWLLISLSVVTGVLTICYRQIFTHWFAWLGLIGTFLITALIVQGVLKIPQAGISLLCTFLFPLSGLVLLIGLFLLLRQRDLGFVCVAWSTSISIWALVIVWRAQGDIIAVLLQSLEHPGSPASIAWLNVIISSTCCLVPLGAISFIWHTGVALRREMYRDAP